MLQKLILKCVYNGNQKISYNWGSLFHGMFMELLPEDIAAVFHDNCMHPYSQYIISMTGNMVDWHIGLLGSNISDEIARTVSSLSRFELKHKNAVFDVTAVEHEKESEHDLYKRFFTGDMPGRRYELEFLTPCTHKSAGSYMLFPSPKHIIQSLIMRFSAFSEAYSFDDSEAIEQIISHTHISSYQLRSSRYHLEGTGITGYTGRIILSISGPEQLARLAGMLLSYSEYAGIGIKTSLGMGGCRVRQVMENKK